MAFSWHEVGSPDDLPEGELRGFRVGGRKLCVGRSAEGYFAIDDECPHAAGSLSEGMIDGREVICPLHAYAFDTGTGECPDDPSCNIRAYPVRQEDGQLQVQLPANPDSP